MRRQRRRRIGRRRTRPSGSAWMRTGPRGSGTVMSGHQRLPGPINVPMSQAVMLTFRQQQALTSNSSGVIAVFISCDPSAATVAPLVVSSALFNDWSSVFQLFKQVKCVQFDLRIEPTASNETKGDFVPNLAISGSLTTSSTPSTYQSVVDNQDSQIYPILKDQSGKGRYHAIRHTRQLEWASTASPAPSTSIYAGCPGGIGIYGDTFPVSSTIASLLITGTYLLRVRD